MIAARWLITGGNGLLGRVIVRVAREACNAPSMVITSRQVNDEFFLDLGLTDISLPKRINVVIHVAGEKRDETLMESINHLGTRRLVEAAAKSGVRRFVYVSSVGVYGAVPHSRVVTESFPHSPRNCYEASKDAGETCVLECCSRFGMEAIIIQPTTVIPFASDTFYPLFTFMNMVRRGYFVWFGSGVPIVNYVSVDDVAAAVVAATFSAPAGSYIINTPALLSDMVGWISEELGVSKPSMVLPCWFGEVAVAIGGLASSLIGPSFPLQRERFMELTNTTYYDPSLLMNEISFEYPVGIEALIRNLAKTYLQRGFL